LAVTFNGVETYPLDGAVHAGFETTGAISRKNYGLVFNVPHCAGGFVIADRVEIELDVGLRGPARQPGTV
jgi:polyisoprenoid-binding protein YceI